MEFQYIYCSCKYKLPIRKYLSSLSILIGEEALSSTEFLHNFIVFQVLDIDRILHEHQLGLEWTHPDVSLLRLEDLASYRCAMQVIADLFPEKGKAKIRGIHQTHPGSMIV